MVALPEGASRVARQLAARSRFPAELADLVGAHTIADACYRTYSRGDIVTVRVPPPPRALRARRVKLYRCAGHDQAVEAVARGGLIGFEPPLPRLLVEAVRTFPGALIDVGANTGLYSVLAVGARSDVRVYAFEPFPAVTARLEANVRLNGRAGKRIRFHAAAVADIGGWDKLYIPPPSGETIETSASMDPDFKETIDETIDVEVTTIDEFWTGSGQPDVGVMKVDTEGTEHRVLSGALRMLERQRPLVVYELLPRANTARIGELASHLGYRDVRLRPDRLVTGLPIAFDEAAWNHALVPDERFGLLHDIARAIEVPITTA